MSPRARFQPVALDPRHYRLRSQPPDLWRKLSEAFRPALQASEEARRRLRESLAGLPDPAIMLEGLQRTAETARRRLLAHFPDNWEGLESHQLIAATRLGSQSGINVLWVPRVEVIRQLLAVEDRERDSVLVAAEVDIFDDFAAQLREVAHPGLDHVPKLAAEAIAAHRDGHHAPAQALAAAALSRVVHANFGYKRFADARIRFERDDPLHGVELPLFRISALMQTFGRALHHTDHAAPGFNRHASTHAIAEDQYTEANSIAAMLLLVGLLRELDYLFEQEDRRRDSE